MQTGRFFLSIVIVGGGGLNLEFVRHPHIAAAELPFKFQSGW